MFLKFYDLTVNMSKVATIKEDYNNLTVTFYSLPTKRGKEPKIVTMWLFDSHLELEKALDFLDKKLNILCLKI